jgi:hypothetical protein
MKHLVLGTVTLAILSGIALTQPAEAAFYGRGRHLGGLSPHERAAIARSRAGLDALRWRVGADGRVSLWERMRINVAQARHNALVYRYRHN